MFITDGGTGTGTAGTGGTGGAGAPPPPPPAASNWSDKFTPEQKGWWDNKGYKDPIELMTAYQGLEKLIGGPREKLIKIPDAPDAPEWGEVFDKLGRPKTPEDYGLKPAAENDDPAFSEWASKNFHELGITKGQAEKLVSKWGEFYEGQDKAYRKSISDKALMEAEGLKKEWGNNFDAEMNVAKQAARAFGMPDEVASKLEETIGLGATMKFLNNVGKKMGEGSFVDASGGGGQNFAVSPGAAQARLNALLADPVWSKGYLAGEVGPKAEMERLQKIIAGS